MGEPTTLAAVSAAGAAGAVGFGIGSVLAGVDGNAVTGSLCGALMFVMARPDLKVVPRVIFFGISLVMGYLFSPALTDLEFWGIRPFSYSGPAAFAASALVVSVTMYAINKRGAPPAPGGTDG